MTTPLATLTDLYTYGAPTSAFGALTDPQRQDGLDSAAAEAMGYFASRGNLPLVAWGKDLTRKICHLATYNLLSQVGYNPNDGADANYKLQYDATVTWLLRVSRGEITPPDILFSQPSTVGSFPKVISKPLRGF